MPKQKTKIPEGWSNGPLGDYILEIGDGGTPKRSRLDYFGGGIPWVVVKDIKSKIEKTKDTLSQAGLKNSSAKLWPAGTVILSFGATIGEVGIAQISLATKQGIVGILVDPEKISNIYLYYCLLSQKDRLNNLATGSTIKEIRPAVIKKHIELFVPSLTSQNKIVEILRAVDEEIEKTEVIVSRSEKLKLGMFNKLLDSGLKCKIKDLCEIKRGASPRPIGDSRYFANGGRGWIRISDVTSSYKYLNKTDQYLSELGESLSVKVNEGDLVMSICATVGKPIIINIPACIHDGFVCFKNLDTKRILTEYLFYFLLNSEKNIQSKGQTGSQKNLNTTIVKNMEIKLPDLDEQKKKVDLLRSIDNKILIYQKIKDNLTQLKKGLTADLLSGQKILN